MYETRIAIVLLDSLADWQKLNAAAFLGSAVGVGCDETRGNAFTDASGARYLPFVRQPMLVYAAPDVGAVRRAYVRGRERGLAVGIYTAALFATKGEADNHREIGQVAEEEHELVGLVLYGGRGPVSKAVKGLRLHP